MSPRLMDRVLAWLPKLLQSPHRLLWGLLPLGVLFATAVATGQGEPITVTDEAGTPGICRSHFAVTGVRCRGAFCDDVAIFCSRFAPEKTSAGDVNALSTDDRGAWSAWFSEEEGQPRPGSSQTGLVSGIQCQGSYCDSMKLRWHSPTVRASGPCYNTPAVSDEDRAAHCRAGYFVRNMTCTGRFCDNISLQCCAADGVIRPSACIQLPRTGRGLSVAAEVTPSSAPGRPPWACPSGFAMSGLKCEGANCSYLTPTCCPYRPSSNGDTAAKYREARPFSEETNSSGGGNGVESATEFVAGVRCSGNYCDNITASLVGTPNLKNGGACRWTAKFSEETKGGACASYEFVAGMRCFGSNCDQVSLKCCRGDIPLN